MLINIGLLIHLFADRNPISEGPRTPPNTLLRPGMRKLLYLRLARAFRSLRGHRNAQLCLLLMLAMFYAEPLTPSCSYLLVLLLVVQLGDAA